VKVVIASLGHQKVGNTLNNLKFVQQKTTELTSKYKKELLFTTGEILAEYKVKNAKGAKKVLAVAPKQIAALIGTNDGIKISKEIIPLKKSFVAPIAKDENLADIIIKNNDKELFRVNLIAERTVEISYLALVFDSIYFKLFLVLAVLWLYWRTCIVAPRKKRRREIERRRQESRDWLKQNKNIF
jgi:hypothetical protein